MDATTHHLSDTEIFAHVRMLLSVIGSLAVARLLTGLAVFVQHPGRQKPDLVHLLWVVSMLIALVHFWWWEMALAHRTPWCFEVYAFVLFYATLNFTLCAILFPLDLNEYTGYRDYFESRRKWFFGLLALTFVVDVIDTALKGHAHFASLTTEYPLRLAAYLVLFATAAATKHRSFHLAFAVGNLAYQVSWIARMYDRMN